MAVQHIPNRAQDEKIEKILKRVGEGKAQIVSKSEYIKWFGIQDATARSHLLKIFGELGFDSLSLHYIDLPNDYVLVCESKQKDWLIPVRTHH